MSSASPVSYGAAGRDVKIPGRMLAGTDSNPLPNIPLIHRPTDQSSSSLMRPPLDVRKRLLIVDDEVPILKLVTRILATDNYEISTAESGEEAAQLVAH